MKKLYFLFILLVFPAVSSFAQMYILNEDFSGTLGTTPPSGWSNTMISGNATDLWHFDNPGIRVVNYPITEPFAIFDAETISGNGTPESAALESPVFDASVSNFILLNFQHTFIQGSGATAKVEAFNGTSWQQVAVFSSSTLNPSSEILDLSSAIGGVTNARIRFLWSGNGSGWWAVDNIRIYASLPLDAGIVSLDNPINPVSPGMQNVAVSLCNFGYNTLSSTTINWTVDGIVQSPFNWNGSVGFGQSLSDIVIGTYNFQDPVRVKIWQTSPNGQVDPNPYNDTISVFVKTTLCGTYTIGGTNPDFDNFSDLASVLNGAGITCPVTILVRDGVYYEQFILRSIPGSSATNTVTLRSESGDSTLAILQIDPGALKFEPMIWLEGTQHLILEGLGLFTGSSVSYANNALLMEGVADVTVKNCYFEVRNQFDYGVLAQDGSRQVDIGNNRFESISGRAGAVHLTSDGTREISIHNNAIRGAIDWGFYTIRSGGGTSNVLISDNQVERCYRAIYIDAADSISVIRNVITNSNDGIYVDIGSSDIEISSNRLTGIKSHPNFPEGTGAMVINRSSNALIFNNFIQTTGQGPVLGISLNKASNCLIHFNSIYITNTDEQKKSKGFILAESSNITAYNNIFNIRKAGTPVVIAQVSLGLDLNRNDYYSLNNSVGYYNGLLYYDLQQWREATGLDQESQSVPPFFTSETDLSINQALLNNAAIPVAGINTDIDGTSRNPVNPDIGAKEYTPCITDAGINSFTSPQNPLGVGTVPVKVILQNQGLANLSFVRINWQVNGQLQAPYTWSGNLAAAANTEVQVGSFDFQAGQTYMLKAWTSEPNNMSDCDHYNDTIYSQDLAVPLCGTYTIGGTSPDFSTISEAVNILNLAGISCPVTFLIRDGLYEEQFIIEQIAGSSATNVVTFQSESHDSSLAVIKLRQDAQKYASVIIVNGGDNIRFRQLGIWTGAQNAFDNNAVLLSNAANIEISNCYLKMTRESDLGIGIQGQSTGVTVKNSMIECAHQRAMAILVTDAGTRGVNIIGNTVKGATDNGYQTIKITTDTRAINVTGNLIEGCNQPVNVAGADTLTFRSNIILNSNNGIFIDNFCSVVEISGNRILGIISVEDIQDGTSGINVQNSSGLDIFNNFIQTLGNGVCYGIRLQNASSCRVFFNSLNITNSDPEGKSIGIWVTGTNNQVQAKNNIFHISNSGIPANIEVPANQLDFDRNDYHSFDQTIGLFKGKLYKNLQVWQDSTGMDQNSLSALPFYTSDTDLSINQIVLNNAGVPVSGITNDIDGILRDPAQPDIGAKEYSPCQDDAGITAVTSPVNPLSIGSHPVTVLLQNQGLADLSFVKIYWQVNGALQVPYSWSGNLPTGSTVEVEAGNFDFQSGKIYIIKAWTSEPNNTADCNHHNDTIEGRKLAAKLCGTYTIGGNDPDFITVSDAVTVLNEAGIDCAVVFLVRNGLYYERLTLGPVSGSSEVNDVTFRSESGDSTLAVLKILENAVNFESLLHLEGASYVRFFQLGLETGAEDGKSNSAVQLDEASQVILENCHIKAINDSDMGISIQDESKGIKVYNSFIECLDPQSGGITIEGIGTADVDVSSNTITGAAIKGNVLLKITDGAAKVKFSGNRIENCYRAVYVNGCDSIELTGNFINNTNEGISVDANCLDINLYANRLTNVQSHQNAPEGTSGIIVRNSVKIDVINNFVQTEGNGPVIGINLQQVDSCKLYYNSVNVTNTDAQNKSKGIYLTGINQIFSKDNICNIKSNGLPFHIGMNVTGLVTDYNDYYHPNGIIGKIENTTYTDLYAWGLALNGDANSKIINPYFKEDTIPLPFQRALNGAGIPIPGIIADIDGKLRFAQAPDIGCMEFKVDYGILDLLSPTLDCYHDDSDSVTVFIRMYGDVPFSELRVAYNLNNGPVHIDTIPGPVYGDIIHTFSTVENLSAEGDYFFRVWLINTLDDNINNDTLNTWRYSKPSPVVTMDWDNFCSGWTVSFSGNATVVSPYSIVSYEWLFGDGDTSTMQNPVHAYLEPGTYDVTLRAYSSAGCYGYLTREIFIDPDFQGLSMTYDLVNETCFRDYTGSLDIRPVGGYPPYSIYLNEQKVNANPVTELTSGTYIIRVTDSQNCMITDTVESISTVYMNPMIEADPLSGMTPLTVQFGFTANNPVSWTWYFSETDADTNQSPEYTFTDYGNHEVILEVRGGHPYYCAERDTVDIFVDIIVTIDVNTVFTPNDDGYNDFFEIKTTAVKELHANIFNQWGNKVYEIDEVNGKWDGKTSGGAEVPDGTYFFAIKAKGFDDKDYERSGAVLLLRNAAQAFPNPVTDRLKVELYGPLDPPASFIVYSVFGQVAMTGSVNDPARIEIDLSPLSKGIYMVKVFDENRHYYVRIIKN